MQRYQPAFAEAFPKRKIKGGMVRQVIWPIAFQETRAVEHIGRDVTARWKIHGNASAQCVALIVIEKEEFCRRREVC